MIRLLYFKNRVTIKKHKVLLKSVTKHLLKLNPLCDAGDIKVHNATLLLGSAIA